MDGYIRLIFDSFLEMHGDRKSGDDTTVICGLARLDSYKVVVIGHQKTSDEPNMTSPAGYRKGLRLISLAEDFNKPVIVFIDAMNLATYNQQTSESIARYMERMSSIMTPSIGVIMSRNTEALIPEICIVDRVINIGNVVSDDSLEAISSKLRSSILEELDQLVKIQPEVLVEQRLRTVISDQNFFLY